MQTDSVIRLLMQTTCMLVFIQGCKSPKANISPPLIAQDKLVAQAFAYASKTQIIEKADWTKSFESNLASSPNSFTTIDDFAFYQRFRNFVWKAQGVSDTNELSYLSRIETNPTYLKNFRSMVSASFGGEYQAFVIGGERTKLHEFDECVALLWRDNTLCTGTLIAPNAILTAGHCTAHRGFPAIIFGDGSQMDPSENCVTNVYRTNFVGGATFLNDISVLILSNDVSVVPAMFATTAELNQSTNIHAVGFGIYNYNKKYNGLKNQVDIPIATYYCLPGECHPLSEFIAGRKGLGKDTCNGDSGGPAYVPTPQGWKLAGITSRPIPSAISSQCGDGGIYVRVDFYRPWLASIQDIHWSQK